MNKINGKKYIGITCQTLNQRFRNGEGYKSSIHFYNAIKKYGWENFEHHVLYDGLSEAEAKDKEIELIKEYDTRNPDKGYNMTPGGEGYSGPDNPIFGKHLTDEHKQKISERLKNRIVSDETRKKRSESLKGRTFSEETLEKMRKAQQERVKRMGDEHPFKKHEFSCAGENNPMHGTKMPKELKQKLMQYHKEHCQGKDNPNAKRVRCIETGIVYDTMKEASGNNKSLASHISDCVHGRRKSAGGYTWEFANNEGENNNE